MDSTTRNSIFSLLLFAGCSSLPFIQAPTEINSEGLRYQPQLADVSVGTAIQAESLSEDDYKDIAAKEFNSFTPENSQKFEIIRPARDVFDFTQANRIIPFVRENGKLRCHTLIWHRQLPNWLLKQEWTKEEVREILVEHIREVVSHFGNTCVSWDVVNEALNSDGSLRKSFWLKHLGEEYIPLAFATAHESLPSAELVYSDYDLAIRGPKQNAAIRLIKQLRAQGVQVHAVAMQMHIRPSYQPNTKQISDSITRFANIGVNVHLSEIDIAIPEDASESEVTAAGQKYSTVLSACLKHESCKSFTVWGFSEKYSWIPKHFPGHRAVSLFDRQFNRTRAYTELGRNIDN